ncbi:MAG: DNA alkylation repair protein [Alphaproteobacteria bacterium]|nr:DNA alkylation repair protein [Alphaproteobacteria bacterium]
MQNKIVNSLYAMCDNAYRDFNSSLIPGVDKNSFIGVRTPNLRAFAQNMVKDGVAGEFIEHLPHTFFEENQLHAFILSACRDFDSAVMAVDKFLPYVDNWATCDQMSPKVFAKNTNKLLPYIKKWIKSKHTYTVRFGVLCLMRYFIDDGFDEKYADMVANIKSDDYYINMMRAWYFATALAKQYERVFPYFVDNRLDMWTHNRAIQKAVESFRVSDRHKADLRALRRKDG